MSQRLFWFFGKPNGCRSLSERRMSAADACCQTCFWHIQHNLTHFSGAERANSSYCCSNSSTSHKWRGITSSTSLCVITPPAQRPWKFLHVWLLLTLGLLCTGLMQARRHSGHSPVKWTKSSRTLTGWLEVNSPTIWLQ